MIRAIQTLKRARKNPSESHAAENRPAAKPKKPRLSLLKLAPPKRIMPIAKVMPRLMRAKHQVLLMLLLKRKARKLRKRRKRQIALHLLHRQQARLRMIISPRKKAGGSAILAN